MNISEAAQASGLSAKAIRYYEELGLVVPARDTNNSYRVYSSENVDYLVFLQQARAAGFDLDDCRQLLVLYGDSGRRCEEVRALIDEKILQLDRQLEAITAMRFSLGRIAAECAVDTSRSLTIDMAAPASGIRPAAMTFAVVGEAGGD